jgi:hypothetical protein
MQERVNEKESVKQQSDEGFESLNRKDWRMLGSSKSKGTVMAYVQYLDTHRNS